MLLEFSPQIDMGDIFTGLSIIAVGIMGMLSFRQSERQKKSEHTINILLDHFKVDEDKEFFRILHSKEDVPDGTDSNITIRTNLNQFEFLGVALRNKLLDEEVVMQDSALRIYRVYDRFKPYIDGRRKTTGVKELYQHLEWVVSAKICPRYKWEDRTKPTAQPRGNGALEQKAA
jgi:hypothetical protein